MSFEFATATRVIFGAGSARGLPDLAASFGPSVLVVSNASQPCPAPPECVELRVEGEPTVALAREGARLARDRSVDVVIGFGGGSAIDAAKAIAALAANPGDPLDYLEVIGRGQPLKRPSLPFIAVPTTAGTGAEVTRNAVLASPEHRFKASLRSPYLLAKIALVDPELALGLPPAVTASTGLDALTQLIEPYVSSRANPLTDPLSLDGMRRAAQALPVAFHDGGNLEARTAMSLASMFGGMALANAGLGVVHGFAAPIGGMFPAPHGAVCAALLPHGMEANIRALRSRTPQHDALLRYAEVARTLTGDSAAEAQDGPAWVARLTREFAIPPLGAYGIAEKDVAELVEKASRASSMKANPIQLTAEELTEVLLRAL
ncbi:MAG: iron-containing alcohol dehydrogenase [Bryobacteraceae bacterium]